MSEETPKTERFAGPEGEKRMEHAEKEFFGEPVDSELVSLPVPKKRGRSPWLMGIVLVLSILLLWWFRFEVAYFFAPSQPRNLGTATELDAGKLPSNQYVTIEAWPNPTRAVKFQRRFRDEIYRVTPIVGQKKILIQTMRTKEQDEKIRKGESNETSVLEGSYTGRLVSFEDLESTFLTRSGYEGVRLFFREKLFVEITDDCFLLMDGVTPHSYWGYLVLAIVVAGFGIGNGVLLVRNIVLRARKRG